MLYFSIHFYEKEDTPVPRCWYVLVPKDNPDAPPAAEVALTVIAADPIPEKKMAYALKLDENEPDKKENAVITSRLKVRRLTLDPKNNRATVEEKGDYILQIGCKSVGKIEVGPIKVHQGWARRRKPPSSDPCKGQTPPAYCSVGF